MRLSGSSFNSAYKVLLTLKDDPYIYNITVNVNNLINDLKKNIGILHNDTDGNNILDVKEFENSIDENLKPILDVFFKSPCLVHDFTNSMTDNVSSNSIETKLLEADIMRKRLSALIKSPNSWVQALLKLPEVKGILSTLKSQLIELTTQTHSSVNQNLSKIKTYFF